MPREAKLFSSSSGSAVRGFLKFRANIPPRWIRNARHSRKHIEPEIARSLSGLKRLRKNRPKARVAIHNASKDLRMILGHWETAYQKENFYRGIRILLELQRNGSSNLYETTENQPPAHWIWAGGLGSSECDYFCAVEQLAATCSILVTLNLAFASAVVLPALELPCEPDAAVLSAPVTRTSCPTCSLSLAVSPSNW